VIETGAKNRFVRASMCEDEDGNVYTVYNTVKHGILKFWRVVDIRKAFNAESMAMDVHDWNTRNFA